MKACVTISGNVQGVGYRWHCRREAVRLDVKGFCRNLADGSVDVFAVCRDAAHLSAFLSALDVTSTSDFGAHVEKMDVKKKGETGFVDAGDFSDFQIRF